MYLFDTFDSTEARKGVRNYIDNTYFVNAFYAACLNACRKACIGYGISNPTSISRAIAASGTGSVGARRKSRLRHPELAEGLQEVDICVRLDPEKFVEFGIYRRLAAGGFSDDDIGRLQTALPM